MDNISARDKFSRIFIEVAGSQIVGYLNILLFLSILIAVFSPYEAFGLAFIFIICSFEVWFVLRVYFLLRATSIGYKILSATSEWYVDDQRQETITSKKAFNILLTRAASSICYYLERGENIRDAMGVLPIITKKNCPGIPDGYTPVQLIFERHFAKGTELPIVLYTDIQKEKGENFNEISFFTHNKPERLNVIINIVTRNGHNAPATSILYQKDNRLEKVAEPLIEYKVEEPYRSIIWKPKKLIEKAVYSISWNYKE